MTDDEILQGIQSNGHRRETAVRVLYDRYASKMLTSFVYRGVSRAEAEDILQETFVNIVRFAGSFRGDAPAAAWFWKIARNCWVSSIRRTKRLSGSHLDSKYSDAEALLSDVDWERIMESVPAAEIQATGESVDECVTSGLDVFCAQFPERGHALLLQMDGSSIQEIALVLGRTPDATKVFLSQCKKKLAPFVEHCADLLND